MHATVLTAGICELIAIAIIVPVTAAIVAHGLHGNPLLCLGADADGFAIYRYP